MVIFQYYILRLAHKEVLSRLKMIVVLVQIGNFIWVFFIFTIGCEWQQCGFVRLFDNCWYHVFLKQGLEFCSELCCFGYVYYPVNKEYRVSKRPKDNHNVWRLKAKVKVPWLPGLSMWKALLLKIKWCCQSRV